MAGSETLGKLRDRLRQSFLKRLPERLQAAHVLLDALRLAQDDPDKRHEILQQLHLSLHTLKGSGASFGYHEIAAAAGEGEGLLRAALADANRNGAGLPRALGRCLRQLETLSAQVPSDKQPIDAPSFALPASATGTAAGQDDAPMAKRDQRLVYLCDDDAEQACQLAEQLICFGYQVEPFFTLDDLSRAIDKQSPAAVIMDIMFPEGDNAGPETLARVNRGRPRPIASIFMSVRDDFAARLESVRANGEAFCQKPVNPAELVEYLDRLTNRTPPEPFHILVVDDEPDIAALHASTLMSAGMSCQIVNDPERVLSALDQFRADLVLMDLYMPGCSGQELARVLRQIGGYLSLPIIYVSSETDAARQFEALQVGADGFLTKPIAPERLVEEVRLRAERMRILRSLMVRDSLTGLFNHNTILQFLEIAVASARRHRGKLCFAMLDVDHFKQVNDTHGHAAGDQVLMALSRTLRLRLRESDLVGRYGGEEFAVVFSDLELGGALEILETLRESFAKVTFFVDGKPFRCTFSAGVAVFPDCGDSRQLTDVADRALYRAKRAGRNRVLAMRTSDPLNLDEG